MTALVPVDQIERMAVSVTRSGLFGFKTPDQAMALMFVAQAENLHPAKAIQEYHIINGKPTLKADAMLARFQAAGGKVEWVEYTDTKVVGKFSHQAGGSVTVEWTVEMGRKAGLLGNPTWTKYPRQMLRSRCIAEGIRTVFPGVIVGSYSEEEGEDMTIAAAPRQAAPPPAPEPVEVVIDVEELKERIALTATIEGMELLRTDLSRLPKNSKERKEVFEAAKKRVDEIKAEMERERQAREEPEIIEAEEGVI
jgi:hypothetical protein